MTSKKVKIDFYLPEFSATKIVSWKCHLDNQTNSRYDMILGTDLIYALRMYLRFCENIIISGNRPYRRCSAPMVDLRNYEFKSLTKKELNLKNPLLMCTLTNASNPRSQ